MMGTPAITPRDERGRIIPGYSLNPAGKPKGKLGGRALALKTLDRVMAKERNQENLANALQAHFDEDPVRFFKTLIMPLLPQDLKVHATVETGFSWMTLPEMIARNRSQNVATSVY